MGKIGDLWVRLGLRKSEFDKGIDDAGRKAQGFGGILNKVKGMSLAAFAAIAAGAAAMAVKFAQHSQRLGDAWNRTMSGMKSAWSTFLTALTDWDWDSFVDRIRDAFNSAKKAYDVEDLEFGVENSIAIRKAEMEEELNRLRIEAQDARKSHEERAKAVKEYLDKVRPLYEEEIEYREKLRNAKLDQYLGQAGIVRTADNREAVQTLLTQVANRPALLNALDQYNKKNQGKDYVLTREDERLIDAFLSDKSYKTGAALAQLATYYQSSGNKEAKEAVDAIKGMYAARGAFNAETRRLQTLGNSQAAQASGLDNNGQAKEDPFLKQAQHISERAEDALKGEITLLTEKYREEKALLEQYNMDTTALTQEYWNNLADIVGEGLEVIEDEIEDFNDDVPELKILDDDDLQKASKRMKALTDAYDDGVERAKRLKEDFIDSVVGGMSGGIQELSDQLTGLEDVNPGAILQALLGPLADMAVREGEIVMATGLGVEAVKESLGKLEGGAAIAAGAALMMIGAAAKSGLAALANGGTGTTTADYGGMSGSGQTLRSELVVRVEGTIKGRDIVISGQNTVKDFGR